MQAWVGVRPAKSCCWMEQARERERPGLSILTALSGLDLATANEKKQGQRWPRYVWTHQARDLPRDVVDARAGWP